MSQVYIYLLEHYIKRLPTNVGLFSSRKKAEAFIKKLPKKNQYTIYKLPLNQALTKGKQLEGQQGAYQHWHFGTYEVGYEKYDLDGNLLEKDVKIEFNWPD
jgi:hypothetical protein